MKTGIHIPLPHLGYLGHVLFVFTMVSLNRDENRFQQGVNAYSPIFSSFMGFVMYSQ